MKKARSRYSLLFYGLVFAAATSVLGYMRYKEAARLLLHLPVEHIPIWQKPVAVGLVFDVVQVKSSDSYLLHGWGSHSQNGALINCSMAITDCTFFIEEAEMYTRHGYRVLYRSIRAHHMNNC